MKSKKEIINKVWEDLDKTRLTSQISKDLIDDVVNSVLQAINYTRCCTEFKCGQQRVFGEDKCIEQCSDCKLDYSDI